MYEKIAWENFCKTGNVESFIEYKLLSNELKIGENSIETNKSEGNNNKGDTI